MNIDKDIQNAISELPANSLLTVAACDMNGVWRGKRVPINQIDKVLAGDVRMPISALGLDIWGSDVEDCPLVFETGDQDGRCIATERGPLLFRSSKKRQLMIPVTMVDEAGAPSPIDPRQVLSQAVARANALGFYPQMALEMEFYFVDEGAEKLRTPTSPVSGKRGVADGILSIDELDHFDEIFSHIYRQCGEMNIDADAAISESGRGQFEINLLHCEPLKAADDAAIFKRIVKLVAREHDVTASFMAKPFADRAGSGMHIHFSMLDADGVNVFDDGGPLGSALLTQSVAGLLGSLEEMSLIWAPHFNSYRRLQPASYAPTGICWAYENRTAAIRIPGGSPKARRIEHRVAGADANPYLLAAMIIHGALDGIEGKLTPPEPITGDAYSLDLERLPRRWIDAVRLFEESEFAKKHLPDMFIQVYSMAKRQEIETIQEEISPQEIRTYLDVV